VRRRLRGGDDVRYRAVRAELIPRHWPKLRAALVLFHLAAVTAIAFPAPLGMSRGNWKAPTVQQEFERWARVLHVDNDDLQEFLWQAGNLFLRWRDRATTPFRPYVSLTGCEQPWRMFVGPDRFPTRLQIQARRGERWDTLFEERHDTYAWRRDLLDNFRVRSQIAWWGWPAYEADYEKGCEWLARRALEDFADAGAVRCRFWRARSPSPEDVKSGAAAEGEWVYAREIAR
jgi:hypothetical protein